MIKIYLYKDSECKKPKKFPSFTIETGDIKADQDLLTNLYSAVERGNTEFILVGPVIFRKKLFHYAINV